MALVTNRRIAQGGNAVAYALVVAGLVVLGNYLAARHRVKYDFTANKQYTLAPRTVQTLKKLPGAVHVTGFVKDDQPLRIRPRKLLEQYEYHAKGFTWEFADPDKNPAAARAAGVGEYDTFVVRTEEGRSEKIAGGIDEEKLTNALVRLAGGEMKSVYFLAGHGERGIEDTSQWGYSAAARLLEDQSYRVLELPLLQTGTLPDDAALLVVAAPKTDLTAAEQAAIDAYLGKGGRLFFMAEPFTLKETARWLQGWGVTPENDIIVDQASRMAGGDILAPIVMEYAPHPVTNGFNVMTLFPTARSLRPGPGSRKGLTSIAIAQTLPGSWGETDEAALRASGKARKERGTDINGPLTMIAAVEQNAEGTARGAALLVAGDADFAANAYLNISGNRDLFLNAVNWLAAQEDRITIADKSPASDPLILGAAQLGVLGGIAIILLPGAALALGVWVTIKRRRG